MRLPSTTTTAGLIFGAALLAGCATGVPSDVNPRQQAADIAALEARQAALNGEISTTSTDADASSGIEALAAGAITEADAAASEGPAPRGILDNIEPQLASDVLPPPIIPRVVAFAVRTTHLPGERQWRRNPLRRAGDVTCEDFETRDQAQNRFLQEGGPERDRLHLDPDGDGFVCGFDPRPFRQDAAAAAAEAGSPIPSGAGG